MDLAIFAHAPIQTLMINVSVAQQRYCSLYFLQIDEMFMHVLFEN